MHCLVHLFAQFEIRKTVGDPLEVDGRAGRNKTNGDKGC